MFSNFLKGTLLILTINSSNVCSVRAADQNDHDDPNAAQAMKTFTFQEAEQRQAGLVETVGQHERHLKRLEESMDLFKRESDLLRRENLALEREKSALEEAYQGLRVDYDKMVQNVKSVSALLEKTMSQRDEEMSKIHLVFAEILKKKDEDCLAKIMMLHTAHQQQMDELKDLLLKRVTAHSEAVSKEAQAPA